MKMRLEWNSDYHPRVRPNLKPENAAGGKNSPRVARQLEKAEWNVAQSKHFDWVPRMLSPATEQLPASL